MFGTITETDLFSEGVNRAKDYDCSLTANIVWQCCIEIAIERIFGIDMLDDFEIVANCMASSVLFLGNKEEIEDFDEKADKFNKLTGFEIME